MLHITYYNIDWYTPMRITTEQVHNAANQLTAAGKRPTLAAVRQALGGGSFTTISEALKTWREREDAYPSVVEVPAQVSEHLEALTSALWRVALQTAEQRYSTERATLETRCKAAVAEVDEAREALATLEAVAEAQEAALAALQAEHDQALTHISTLEAEARQTTLTHREAVTRLTAEVQTLEARLLDAQHLIDTYMSRAVVPSDSIDGD